MTDSEYEGFGESPRFHWTNGLSKDEQEAGMW